MNRTDAEDFQMSSRWLMPPQELSSGLQRLTEERGCKRKVSLYLNSGQVDTPLEVVSSVWNHVSEFRSRVNKVVDFGAGDGRFALKGVYGQYIGYEIDGQRFETGTLPPNASIIHQCAFSTGLIDADLSIGNPPYVRNQYLPPEWRERVARMLFDRTGVLISGLANAWQYFFLLSLASTTREGLVALVIPYEWVCRPAAHSLREYIQKNSWNTYVYRLYDRTFKNVLTTSSITVIDKAGTEGSWEYFVEISPGKYRSLESPSGAKNGVLTYCNRADNSKGHLYARRGLSPGTQKVLTLTEGERVHFGLRVGSDVVACVTSLRHTDSGQTVLSDSVFDQQFRLAGRKCWLVKTDVTPSARLQGYLSSVDPADYQTATCLSRADWWRFKMPEASSILVSSGFRGSRPKALINEVRAHAVGGVSGIYGVSQQQTRELIHFLHSLDLTNTIVSHSTGLKKLEINQLNTLLALFNQERLS